MITAMFFLVSFLIGVSVMVVGVFFIDNSQSEMSDMPFECGFSPISYSRIPLAIQFYSLIIVFLIFDLEVAIYLPLIVNMGLTPSELGEFSFTVLILMSGLLIEWYDGSFKWTL
uniref:NADH dehydrogenase subunit 3 n=1 Tax=Austromenopon paululum TaxID=2965261 RepID=UPI0026E28C58|nr:NADH dehydrogenase subunit 3 [Austromenopon paululum]WJJ69864.1 NADH dehydrogenase subunit 3 [Austromenopon paululum]